MTSLAQRIQALSDIDAQRILTTFVKNQPGYRDAVLSPEFVEALGHDRHLPPMSVDEGELARATLLLMADEPQCGPIIGAMVSHQSADQLSLVETTAVIGAVLFILGTHITLERDKGGNWRFKIEKKPTDPSILTSLMEKLFGFAQKKD